MKNGFAKRKSGAVNQHIIVILHRVARRVVVEMGASALIVVESVVSGVFMAKIGFVVIVKHANLGAVSATSLFIVPELLIVEKKTII